jgi:hypothetical protein
MVIIVFRFMAVTSSFWMKFDGEKSKIARELQTIYIQTNFPWPNENCSIRELLYPQKGAKHLLENFVSNFFYVFSYKMKRNVGVLRF